MHKYMTKFGSNYLHIYTEFNTTLFECPFDTSSRTTQYAYKLT